MQIREATIHHLAKAANTHGEGSVAPQVRRDNLPIDETLNTVCKDLLALYNRTTDSQGTFGADANVHVFPLRFKEYLNGTLDFRALTAAAVALIAAEMEGARFSTGGYALFVRYQEPPNDFLLIAMLKLKPGAGIDEATLALLPTLNIDLSLLHEAARINLTRLIANSEPYLTFITGARKSTDVTEYFRKALACTNFTNAAEQTKQLIAAADAFVAQRVDLITQEAKQRERLDMRKRLHGCLRDNPDEISLTTAAAHIYPTSPEEFVTFARVTERGGERRYPFNDRFRADKKTVRSLKRIGSAFGNVRVSFDVADVQSGAVSYDQRRDALIIKNPPDKLKQEVSDYASNAAD